MLRVASGVELAMFDVVGNSTAPGTIANFNAACCCQESEAISAQCNHMSTTTTTKAFAFLNKICTGRFLGAPSRVPEMKGHFVNEVCGLFRINAVYKYRWEKEGTSKEMRNFNLHMFQTETNIVQQ